jgi:1,4-dihydroxy-6-naphthoate synthase
MNPSILRIAISSCPNDTFCFQPWAEECIATSLNADFFFNDIDTLNRVAMASAPFDVTKLSAACLGAVSDTYVPLSSGAAFAIHGGPKLLAKSDWDISDLSRLRLAIPGKRTSAYAAYSLLFGPPTDVVEMSSTDIIQAIREGICDVGLVIHETRSAPEKHGLVEIADVGEVYRAKFGAILPLGVIVAKRSLGPSLLHTINDTLFRSIREARRRSVLSSFVLDKALETDGAVLWQHIHQYVTDETELMTAESQQWLTTFTQLLSRK